MARRLWANYILWGLGDRLEKKNDYKSDLLIVVDLMLWFSVIFYDLPTGLMLYWLLPVLNPASSLIVQIAVGYVLVRGSKRLDMPRAKPPQRQEWTVAPGATEEP